MIYAQWQRRLLENKSCVLSQNYCALHTVLKAGQTKSIWKDKISLLRRISRRKYLILWLHAYQSSSGWERLAECKIDFLIVSLKLLFYSDHINNFRWTLIPTKYNSFDRVFCLATLFADNFIISNKCTWAFHCSFFTNYTTTPIRIQIRQQQYAWLKTHCIPL